jgi:hypothetical protein
MSPASIKASASSAASIAATVRWSFLVIPSIWNDWRSVQPGVAECRDKVFGSPSHRGACERM